jgi:uncharacterized integral membrane protein
MSVLIIAVTFGLLFAVLATQNTNPVTVQAGNFIFRDIPLYLIVLFSLLTGLVISWILSLFGWASSAMTLSGKNSELRRTHREAEQLQARVHELENENAQLRGEVREADVHDTGDERYEEHRDRPSPFKNFFDRFRSHPSV